MWEYSFLGLYLCWQNQSKNCSGGGGFIEKLGGARMENVPAVVCKFLQVNFLLENCVS